MIRSLIIAVLLLSGSFLLSKFFVGYPRAGTYYIKEHREMRKSVRHGSAVYYGRIGGGGFRGGK